MQSSERPDDVILEVRNVSKKFCRELQRSFIYGLQDLGRQAMGLNRHTERMKPGEFWALRDISFTLKRGESLGIMGANGTGKTTLLRIISGMIKPDGGSVWAKGRVVPLFARGAGFSKILTCRENAYLNLLILGMESAQARETVEKIIAFAEIPEELADAPLKTYSTGLNARLSFACAVEACTHLLLVDEALAVGDMRFRAKCYRRLNEMRENGTSIVMVTHSLGALTTNTDRSLYLRHGELVMAGETPLVASRYEEDQLFNPYLETVTSGENSGILFFQGTNPNACVHASTGELLRVHLGFVKNASKLTVAFEEIPRSLGIVLEKSWAVDINETTPIELQFPELGLVGGVYRVRVTIEKNDGTIEERSTGLRVSSRAEISQNLFFQPLTWSLDSLSQNQAPQPSPERSSEISI